MTDLEIYLVVRNEALASAGVSMTLRNVLAMTDVLAKAFEDDFDIEKACDALDQAQEWAELLAKELRRVRDESN